MPRPFRGAPKSSSFGITSARPSQCLSPVDTPVIKVRSQGSSELSRPGASGEEADSSRLQGVREGHKTMEFDGAGEIVFGHRGLMQDSVQLQGQQGKIQQMVLGGCGGEALGEAGEEIRNGYGENGGAAARAAAGVRPRIIAPMSRQRDKQQERDRRERERRKDRSNSGEEFLEQTILLRKFKITNKE